MSEYVVWLEENDVPALEEPFGPGFPVVFDQTINTEGYSEIRIWVHVFAKNYAVTPITTDTRLIRRTVRDARDRGYTAQDTIARWESVRRGEKRYIFPYQENADVMFNSALVYELAALKPLAEPILRQVPFGTPEHIEAKRLLSFLEWFSPMDHALIPDNSIIKEFIGESRLKDLQLWQSR